MLFDDIMIDTEVIDGKLYVDVEQFRDHLIGSAEVFAEETKELAHLAGGLTVQEKYYSMGMVHGMWSIILMLRSATDEHKFEQIETVEDLLQKFRENDAS